MKAICTQCGTFKDAPWAKCARCGFTPEGEDLVKAAYCSVWRFSDDPDEEVAYEDELSRMSEAIQAGQGIIFDDAELQRLREVIDFLEAGSPGVWKTFLRFLLPALIFLTLLYSIVAWLERSTR
jgi:hypothetical protein